MNVLFYFFHSILCAEHTIVFRKNIIAHFAIVASEDFFIIGTKAIFTSE